MPEDFLPPPLDEETLIEILFHAEQIDAVIVGGQSLNVWAEYYHAQAGDELSRFAPYQSKDIDFLGDRAAARELAERLKGREIAPDRHDTVTPNSAIVVFERNGVEYIVDFLGKIAGVNSVADVKNTAVMLDVPNGEADDISIRVAHPHIVLLTRIAGLTVLQRTDGYAVRQMGAAPIVLREHLKDELDQLAAIPKAELTNATRKVTRQIADFVGVAASPSADEIFANHGIDILPHALALADHPAVPEKFAEHQICQRLHRHAEQRARTLAERQRKAKREASR